MFVMFKAKTGDFEYDYLGLKISAENGKNVANYNGLAQIYCCILGPNNFSFAI